MENATLIGPKEGYQYDDARIYQIPAGKTVNYYDCGVGRQDVAYDRVIIDIDKNGNAEIFAADENDRAFTWVPVAAFTDVQTHEEALRQFGYEVDPENPPVADPPATAGGEADYDERVEAELSTIN